MDGFTSIDWSAPLDGSAVHAAIPADAFSKGFLLAGIVKGCERRGKKLDVGKSYVAFKDYPTAEYAEICERAARLLWPEESPREGLRRVGHMAYPDLAGTLIGRVVFGVLGKDIRAITRIVDKAYSISGTRGKATVLQLGDDSSVVRLEEAFVYVDCLQIGAFEGALMACDLDGEIKLKRLGPASADLYTRWWPKGGPRPG